MALTRKSRSVSKRFPQVYKETPDEDAGNGNKSGQWKRKLSSVLGSRWSKEELGFFYKAYRKYGRDWKKVAGVVGSRSVEMVEALYNMNKAYLSLPDGTASAVGLIAMMTDHYNILDMSGIERETNDGPGTSQKPPKRCRGKSQHSVSKGLDRHVPDLLHSESFVSSYGCPSSLKKRRSSGSRLHAFGKRTLRFPVSYPYDKGEKYDSPNKQGPKSDIDFDVDEVAHGAALALAEALRRGGSFQVSQTPNRRTEHKQPWPVRSGEEMLAESEMASSKLIGITMDEDCWEGSLRSREAENGDFSRDTNSMMYTNGLGTAEAHRKGKNFHGKKREIQNIEIEHFDDVGEASSGSEGLNLSSVKEKIEIELTNTKNVLFSRQDTRKKSRLVEDESTALDALHTLAELSTKLAPTYTVESESYVQMREEARTFDVVDKSNIPERVFAYHKKDKPKISGAKEKGNHIMVGVNTTAHKNAKLGRHSALDVSDISQAKQRPHQFSSKMRKSKHKSFASKLQVSKDGSHGDYPLSEPEKTKASAEQGKKSMNKPKCAGQLTPHLKQRKPVGPPECSSNADLQGAVNNSAISVVNVSTVNQVNLPTKLRSRRKMDLRKALVQKGLKSLENIGNGQPNYSSLLHERAHDLKEKLSHCLASPMLQKWCAFEWFYSAIDYPWFTKHELVEFVNHLGLGHVPTLNRTAWSIIRSYLGKPRRLSQKFLKDEREELENFRESVRTTNTEVQTGIGKVLSTDLACSLSVGQRVIAYHPKTREIHDGSILTVDRSRCRVQFDRPELGIEFVMDIDCMTVVNSVENMSAALRRRNITVNKVHENFDELLNIQPKEWKIGGYVKCSPNEILENADGPSQVPSLTYTVNTYSKQAKIQAREADIQALVDLNRALNKKEVLLLDLRHMHDELLKNQKDGDNSLKDSEPFKKEYATVLIQMKEANSQVYSALENLKQRNTFYQGNYPPPCWKPVASSGDPTESLSFIDHSAFLTQESAFNVIEIVESSRWKAQTMVDVAVQEEEDVLARIGEVADSANSRHSGANPGMLGRSFTPQVPGHCDSACQDQANSCMSEPTGTVHATGPNPNIATEQNEVQIPSALISSCVATFLMIQKCTERQYPPAEVAQILDSAVTSLQPCCSQNLSIYREIQMCMGFVKNQILALVPT